MKKYIVSFSMVSLLILSLIQISCGEKEESFHNINNEVLDLEGSSVSSSARKIVKLLQTYAIHNAWGMPQALDRKTLGEIDKNPSNYDKNGEWVDTDHLEYKERKVFRWKIVDGSKEKYSLFLNFPDSELFWLLRYSSKEKNFLLYKLGAEKYHRQFAFD